MSGFLSFIATALGVGNLLSTSSKRRSREEAQVGVIQEQFVDVEGRIPEIQEFYDKLTAFSEQGAELSRKGVSQDFISQAFQLGQTEREGIRQSGMAQTSTQDLSVQREFQSREYSNVLDLLEQNRQGELLRIGKARETELQGIEDILYQLETEIAGRTGGETFLGSFVEKGGLFGLGGGLLGGLFNRGD